MGIQGVAQGMSPPQEGDITFPGWGKWAYPPGTPVLGTGLMGVSRTSLQCLGHLGMLNVPPGAQGPSPAGTCPGWGLRGKSWSGGRLAGSPWRE